MAVVGVVLVWNQESTATMDSLRNIFPFSDLKCTNASRWDKVGVDEALTFGCFACSRFPRTEK
jgi:hypothetical protein